MDDAIDVVVVGAGPVGLLAAIELTLGGARVLVLERLAAANTASKALGVGPLGSEALARRGMGAALAAAEARVLAARQQVPEPAGVGPRPKFSGHFAGLLFTPDEARAEPERRARLVDQHAIELMLSDRAGALGIDVRRACAVTHMVQRADGVDVGWTAPSGDGQTRCAYLVGCDGGRSPVRKMAGFAFPGSDPTLTMYTAVVTLDHPERLPSSGWHRTAGGVFSYGAFPNRLFMLDFTGPPQDREAPVTLGEVEALLRRASGIDVRVTALEAASRWTDNTRLVDTYRSGRVLLAGDAAHVHSPFGGQGMSLGLCDAANLGWKLAAVVRGDRPDTLLDSYTAERRPVAQAVLANTLAQVAIMRPDPQAGAMRDIMASLLRLPDVNRVLGATMSGLSTRYDLGSERDEVGRLVGDRPVGDGRLHEVMGDGMGVLLDAGAEGKASKIAANARRVRRVAVSAGPSMLIRPDGCVAWAGEADATDGLEDALGRWFGPATGEGHPARV